MSLSQPFFHLREYRSSESVSKAEPERNRVHRLGILYTFLSFLIKHNVFVNSHCVFTMY